MYAVQYHYRVRAEFNKELLQEAEYERWWQSTGLSRALPEGAGQRLLRQAREWFERQNGSLPCNEAFPACGLVPIA